MNLGQDGNALVKLLVLNAVIFVCTASLFMFFFWLPVSSKDSFITACIQLVCFTGKSGKD